MRCTILLFTGALLLLGASSPDIRKIIEQSSRLALADQDAQEVYDYSETDLQPDGSKKTFRVHMLDGSPYNELVAINGKPLPREKQSVEQRKLQEEISRRRGESSEARAKRIADFRRDQDRDKHFLEQLTRAFNFTLVGERTLGAYHVYVLRAEPKPGYQPPDRDSHVLTGMRGTLWIDKQTLEWVRVEAEVVRPVSIEGFLATVEPGTRFELEKAPAADGHWFAKHYSMSASAKILGLLHHRNHEEEAYFNYKKSQGK